MTRYLLVVALVMIAVMGAQPAWATLPTPSQPILVVQDSTSTNAYQNFVPEMLTTEGLNGFQVAQLGDLNSSSASFLASYDVVILPHLTLTAAQATLFQNYVNGGGTLVGFRPDQQLANVFGVAPLGSTLQEAWLKMDTTSAYAPSMDSEAMRFHGTADLYSLNGASALATLYNNSNSPTTSPAVSINTYGLGKAILFSFDLAQSIALMRQGNPAWAGYPNTHDGLNTMRASQMFMDKSSGQFWNDLGDGALNDVPQADIQMRLFSNTVTLTNAAKRPLPRLWYYPNQSRSMFLMTGDDHSYPVSDALSEISNISSYGGLFSYNLWYPFTTVTNAQVNTWLTAGYSMGIHFNDTAEVDSSGIGGSAASWNGMQSVMSTAIASFATTYPSAPFPVTTRNHFLIWVSNDANGTPDQVAQAKLFQNNGIQLDTSYSSAPNRWGYMTGSGLPMKFLDPVAGTVIPVYEQATQYENDVQINVTSYSMDWSTATAQNHYVQSLSDSLNKYNTVITMLFHPEDWANDQSAADAALQYAKANSIPMSATGTWLAFWQARAATTMTMPSFTSNTLTFTATGAPAGLTLLVPFASSSNKVVSTFKVDNVSKSFTVAEYQGVTYASLALTAGTHNISVSYTTAGRILGLVSPSAAAPSTSIQVQGGSITQSVPVASNGTYVVGPLPAGTYTVSPVSSDSTFSPSSQSVTLGTADVTNVNFTATEPISGETLFTTQTPTVTNTSDGPTVNHELGTAFTSGVAGQITGIRFWKASGENGATHTGRIWSSTGTLLTSVTFINESPSGWQQQVLTTPLSITANTQYVVSVNTGNSYYVDTPGGLSSQVVNLDLKSVVGNNGLYATSPGQFPTGSFQGSNYFRDVVFVPSGATYSISGTIGSSTNGPGTTVTLSGAASATATADGSGNYTFNGLSSGSYTVTPTKAGFTFSPTNLAEQVGSSNITGVNFTATAVPTHTISGTIGSSTNGPGTTVTLSGAASATTTADGSGNYTFSGLVSGSYTVTPTKAGFTFSPTSLAEQVGSSNITGVNFTATAVPTYSISGTIGSSTNGPGTTVTLSGAASGTTTADASGNYTFSGLLSGSYTVTPTKAGFTFSPTSLAEQVGSSNITGVNFTATAVPTYSISGTIGSSTNGPGTTVTLSGAASGTTTADASGNYTFSGLLSGSYTVTPTKAGFTFSPTSLPEQLGGANITGVNFTATASPVGQTLFTTQTPGTINDSDGPTADHELGMAFTSDVAGQINGIRFWKGSNENGATHTGRIWSSAGTLLTSVTFTNESASGWQQQLLTTPLSITANTQYVVSVNTGNSYYVDTLGGLSSQVINQDLSSVATNNGLYAVTPGQFPTGSFQGSNYFRDVVFISGATYSISGTVGSSTNGPGTTVTLSGAASATTTADASGNYTFSSLSSGSYTVTPTKAGFTFSPTSLAEQVGSSNITGVNFTATAVPTYSISGTIGSSTNGPGTTVTLSGAASATATADASGNYTFSGLSNGSYTVTPTKTGFTFSPTSLPELVSGSNITGVNFTATATSGPAIDVTVFGDRTTAATSVVSATFSTTATNELLLAMVGTDVSTSSGTNNSVTSVTGGGLTWVLVQRANTQRGTAEIWRAFATGQLSNVTVTANYSLSAISSITVMSFKGVRTTGTNGSGAIGAIASASSASGVITASLVTTGSNSLVVGTGEDWFAPSSISVGAGQTLIHQLASPNLATLWTQRQTATTPASGTTVTINDTAPTTDMYNLAICEILAP